MPDTHAGELSLYTALAPRMTLECEDCHGTGVVALLYAPNILGACPDCHGTGKVALLMDGSIPVNHFLGDGTPIVPLGLVLETADRMGLDVFFGTFRMRAERFSAWVNKGPVFLGATTTLSVLRAIKAALDAREAGAPKEPP